MLGLYEGRGTLPALGFPSSNFRLERLQDLWRQVKAGRDFPCKSEFTPQLLKPWLGNVGLIDVEYQPQRFFVRLVGEMLVKYHGQDATGKYIDECVAPAHLDISLKPYREVLSARAPVFSPTIYVQPGTMRCLMQRLYLPCSSDSSTIDRIIVAVYAAREMGDF